MQPETWRFELGSHGKPRLAEPRLAGDLRFNLSHCRSLVAVAVAREREVGIDVEAVSRTVPSAMDLARRYFSPREADALAAQRDESQRQREFLRRWTAKEALVKATGHGLSLGLDQFEVDVEAGRYGLMPAIVAPGPWHWSELTHPGHFVSLACQGVHPKLDCREVRWDAPSATFREVRPAASLRSPP